MEELGGSFDMRKPSALWTCLVVIILAQVKVTVFGALVDIG